MPKRNKSKGHRARTQRDVPRGIGATFKFEREFIAFSNTLSAGTPFLAALDLGPSNWPASVNTFINTFDIYHLEYMDVIFTPHFSVNTSTTSGDDEIMQLAFVRNYDDLSVPATFDAVLSQGGAKTVLFNRRVTVRCQPRLLLSAASAAGTAQFVTMPCNWINASSSVKPLFLGVKYAIQSVGGIPGNGRFDVSYRFSMKLAQALTG